jgi:hypothetical protein
MSNASTGYYIRAEWGDCGGGGRFGGVNQSVSQAVDGMVFKFAFTDASDFKSLTYADSF